MCTILVTVELICVLKVTYHLSSLFFFFLIPLSASYPFPLPFLSLFSPFSLRYSLSLALPSLLPLLPPFPPPSPPSPPFPPPSLPSPPSPLFSLLSPSGHQPWLLHFSDTQFPEVKVQVPKTAYRTNAQLWRREHNGGKWHDGIALCSFGKQKKKEVNFIKRDIGKI